MNPDPQLEKGLQQALEISELRYRRLFETAQDGILILDASTGQITDANPFLLDLLGYSREQILGRRLWEIGLFKDRTLSESAFETLQKDRYIRYENLPLETQDGREIEVEFVSNVYEVDHQRVIQCNIRDITERRRLEAQLQQVQKMETVGQLAGGVAHGYNNILTSTLLQLELLLHDPNLPEDTKRSLRRLEREAEHAAGLTRQLLMFSRRQTIQLKAVDLNAVLANLVKVLRRLLGEHISLEFHAGSNPLWIEADTGMIEQVVTNLCVNARDAMMPKGGRLIIDANLVELDAAGARANPEARAGMFVCLLVADTGRGMDAHTLRHTFEPFFTTKEVGKGAGLGLSTVYGIAKQHKGWVEATSQMGHGSTFRVFLPALAIAAPPKSERFFAETPKGRETILVVEDEATVRDMVTLGLQLNGYRVLGAGSGQEAIRVWEDHAGEIDLLFTDMRMPSMTGMELYERLKRTKANLKVIISSGYSEEILKLEGHTSPGIIFLPKPYGVKSLAVTVRNCLDQA